MVQPLTTEPIPLSTDTDGVIRVAGTRVTLETVVQAFDTGATPEEIAQDFPVLQLDDVYAVITYCLRHRKEVEAYLERRQALAGAARFQKEGERLPAGKPILPRPLL